MDAKKVVKFNLYASCALLAAFVLMFVGTTIAYFTSTKHISNTFTSGNVEIALSEAAVMMDEFGNLVEDKSLPRFFGDDVYAVNDYGAIYPGQSVYKDPTITNTCDDSEWVAAKITFSHKLSGFADVMKNDQGNLDIKTLLSGGLLNETVSFGEWNGISNVYYNDNYALVPSVKPDENKVEFFFFCLKPLQAGKSVVVFDHLMIPREFNNAQTQHFVDIKLEVNAFGVQTMQFDNCFSAMTQAFPEHIKIN